MELATAATPPAYCSARAREAAGVDGDDLVGILGWRVAIERKSDRPSARGSYSGDGDVTT
jgi:hypothetical protein